MKKCGEDFSIKKQPLLSFRVEKHILSYRAAVNALKIIHWIGSLPLHIVLAQL